MKPWNQCADVPARARRLSRPVSWRSAFTLIEVMVVVAIIGIIVAAGVPSMYRLWHKEGFRKSVDDLLEASKAARRDAIMQNTPAELVFNPREGTFSGGGKSGRIEGGVLQLLEVNLRNYNQAESAHVRFFPNGTSDELVVILRSDSNEQRGVVLDIMTGMPLLLNERGLEDFLRGKL